MESDTLVVQKIRNLEQMGYLQLIPIKEMVATKIQGPSSEPPLLSCFFPPLCVIRGVRTHEGERGSGKSVHHVYKGKGADTPKKYAKSPFLHVFCNVFIFNVLLSYFAVFGNDIHYCFIKHLLPIGHFKNVPVRNWGGGGHMSKSTYAIGVVAVVHVRTMVEELKFAIVVRMY